MSLVAGVWRLPTEVRASILLYAAVEAMQPLYLAMAKSFYDKEAFPENIPETCKWQVAGSMEPYHAAKILITKARQFFGDGVGDPSGITTGWGDEVTDHERVFITKILPGSQCTIVHEGNDFCAGDVLNKQMAWAHLGSLNIKGVRRADDERRFNFDDGDDRWKPAGKYIYREYGGFQRCVTIASYVWEANAQRTNPLLERVADFSGPTASFMPADRERDYINSWDVMARGWTGDNDPYQARIKQLPAAQLQRHTTSVAGLYRAPIR